MYVHTRTGRPCLHAYMRLWIRSFPGKVTCRVRSSAMMHPTDHISTAEYSTVRQEVTHTIHPSPSSPLFSVPFSPPSSFTPLLPPLSHSPPLPSPPLPSRPTLVVVLHPVEHDLGGPVPPGSHVARHLISRCPSQSKVKNAKLTTLVHCNVASLEVLCMGRHWTVTVEGLDQGG